MKLDRSGSQFAGLGELTTMKTLEQSPLSDQFPQAELTKLQADLDRLREQISKPSDSVSVEIDGETALNNLAKEILRSRRRREKIFDAALFGEPAWDILLELYVAEFTGQRLCVSTVCHASAVPATTALRWVVKLENEKWIERMADPRDRRRTRLALTSRGLTAMRRYLNDYASGLGF
jgi:DNA-binding MarR family transcriptional regulator